MKKTLIALAIAGLSFNAAAVNFDNGSSVAVFAKEIQISAAGTTLGTTVAEKALESTASLGFSITEGNKRYIRFDVTNAEFDKTFSDASLTVVSGADAGVVKVSQQSASFVIFEVAAPTGKNIAPDAAVTFLADKHVVVKSATDVKVSYRLFETAIDAVNNDVSKALNKKDGTLLTFANALEARVVTKGSVDKIDVNSESKKFLNNASPAVVVDNTIVSSIAMGIADTDATTVGVQAARLASGVEVAAVTDILAAIGNKLTVSGDLSAGLVNAQNELQVGTLTLGDATATTIAADKAEFALNDATAASDIVYKVQGVKAIAPQTMTAVFTPVAKAGFEVAPINLGEIGTLVKNGSSAIANLVLAPDTSYTNMVRISNTSGLAGKFFVTVIADDGKEASFPLSDVAGQPAALDAGASTQQMKVADIYAAAQAKGLVLTGDKKLRLKVEGEVASLSLQNYTISKDGNALNTMNAF